MAQYWKRYQKILVNTSSNKICSLKKHTNVTLLIRINEEKISFKHLVTLRRTCAPHFVISENIINIQLALNSWSNTFSKYTFTGRIFGNWNMIHVFSLLTKIYMYHQIMFAFCTTLYVHRSCNINGINKKKTVMIQGIEYFGFKQRPNRAFRIILRCQSIGKLISVSIFDFSSTELK